VIDAELVARVARDDVEGGLLAERDRQATDERRSPERSRLVGWGAGSTPRINASAIASGISHRCAIQAGSGDTDANDVTEADPASTPLAVTPSHPEYPGAHSCLTGAVAHAVEDFFGTQKLDVTLTSTSVPGIPLAVHTFTRTRDIIKEIIDARIYGGMHYRTSAVHGIVIAIRWRTGCPGITSSPFREGCHLGQPMHRIS
jgi:hypothetical protein